MYSPIDEFFAKDVRTFHQRLEQIDAALDPAAPAHKDETYQKVVAAMHDIVTACRRLEAEIGNDVELLRDTQTRFQAATSEWFQRSWIGERARTKPRGYPGDYLLLNTIYDQEPKSPGLGGYVDLYIMDLLLAQSVRARWQLLREFLVDELSGRDGDVALLNVACGPCREYAVGIEHANGARARLTCLDNDQEALDFVESNIAPSAPGVAEFRCARYNALRMKSSSATIRNFGRSDIIYSIGLCDYIDDDYMIGMLTGWRESLKPGGVVFVAFKDCERYDKTPYQWLLDWHFYQRTEEDCRMLFQHAGYDTLDMEMTRDETGVIMNFVSRVPVAAPVRFDTAEPLAGPHALPTEGALPGDLNASLEPGA